MAPFPGSTRYTCSSFTLNGKGYVTLGFRPYTDETWEYNPATNAWTLKSPFPGGPRQSSTSFVIGNYAYVGGGAPLAAGWVYFTRDWYRYDATSDTWTRLSNFPGDALMSRGTFVMDGKGYVVCGTTEDQYNYVTGGSNDVWQYDPATDNWTLWGMFPDSALLEGSHTSINGLGYIGQGQHYVFGTYSRVWWSFGQHPGPYDCAATIKRFIINQNISNFQASGNFSPGAVLSWNFGDGGTASGTSVFHQFPGNGTYTVTLTVTDTAANCSTTVNQTVTITNVSNCSVAVNSVNVGSQFTLYADVTGVGPYQYAWSSPDDSSFSSTVPNPYVNLAPATPTTYCVTITDNTGCSVSACAQVVYTPAQQNCETYLYTYPDNDIPGMYHVYFSHTGGGPVSYYWTFGDGNSSTQQRPSHMYAVPGKYTICVTVTDINGCVSSFCDSSFYAFKNGGGLMRQFNTVDVLPTNVNYITEPVVSLYPNPASGMLNIKTSTPVTRINVVNALGQVVRNISLNGINNLSLETEGWADGVYFVHMYYGDKVFTRKVAINR